MQGNKVKQKKYWFIEKSCLIASWISIMHNQRIDARIPVLIIYLIVLASKKDVPLPGSLASAPTLWAIYLLPQQ